MDSTISLAVTLFILSMINERILNFIKLRYSCKKMLGAQFGNLKVRSQNQDDESIREKNLIQINLICGFVVSLLLRADMISILKHVNEPSEGIGWDHLKPDVVWNLVTLIPGCFLTGCFLSLGSKFWHDLLDVLLQVKNYKRILTDQETLKIDNIKILEAKIERTQSDFIDAAYLQIQTDLFDNENVKAISLQNNERGYFFEITLENPDPSIAQLYKYNHPKGGIESIPIMIVMLDGDTIEAHGINLGNKISNSHDITRWGTMGCFVRKNDDAGNNDYILTCCHNVIEPGAGFKVNIGTSTAKLTEKDFVLGTIMYGVRDQEIDAALIKIEPAQKKKINNELPKLGQIQKERKLTNTEVKNGVPVLMYGAVSEKKSGTVVSIYTSVKMKYSDGQHKLINLIAVSENGKALSEGGDSGSCVLDASNRLLGILVGGSKKVSYVIPASTIFSKLNIALSES